MRDALVAPLLSLLAASVCGQTTHLVGPGGFPQISDAILVAAPGDVILVQPGTYSYLVTQIGVTVRGLGPGVNVYVVNTSLPAGQTLHLANLNVLFFSTIAGGSVTLEGCNTSSLRVSSTRLTLQSCTCPIGFDALDSRISAIDSTFVGVSLLSPMEAVKLTSSTFHGSFVTCDANGASLPAVNAINSTVWISDSTLIGGTTPSAACAVVAQQGRLARCTITPPCTPAIPTTGPLLGVHRPNVLQSPGPFSLDFSTEPNGLVAVFVAADVDSVPFPGLEQAVLLDLTTTFHVETLVANASGVATGTWTVPAGLTNQTFFFQAVGTASPLQLSPVAGGIVR